MIDISFDSVSLSTGHKINVGDEYIVTDRVVFGMQVGEVVTVKKLEWDQEKKHILIYFDKERLDFVVLGDEYKSTGFAGQIVESNVRKVEQNQNF